MNNDLPNELRAKLSEPLPGWAAQVRFQPELSFGRHLGPAPPTARPAAVLLLLYPRDGHWHLPLMLRPADMPDHAGQVSFPGGVVEPGESSRQAALREFAEELGPPADDFDVLGPLSPIYLFASNFAIEPWVAATDHLPRWNPSSREVDRLLEIPLSHLADPRNTGQIERRQRGLSFRAPCFRWRDDRIWGATSMILAELIAGLRSLRL